MTTLTRDTSHQEESNTLNPSQEEKNLMRLRAHQIIATTSKAYEVAMRAEGASKKVLGINKGKGFMPFGTAIILNQVALRNAGLIAG